MAKRVARLGDEARYLYAQTAPRKPPAKRLPGESKAAKRERRRAEHREETASIRKAVFERATIWPVEGPQCENLLTQLPGLRIRCQRMATELHHLKGGAGRRRQKQTVENCRAYCFDCHRAAHRAGAREGT
jgi:hypothetical protein